MSPPPSDQLPRGRVLIFVHDLRASGVVRNTLAIARRAGEHHEVLVVARHGDGLLASEASDDGYAVRTLFDRATSPTWPAASRLRALVKAWQPDVLLSSGNRGHIVAWTALRGLKRPLKLFRISNSIATGRRDFGLRNLWASLLAKRADGLFLVGTATAASRVFARAVAEGRAEVITNGVDVERARRLGAAPEPQAFPGADLPIVLSVGRIAPQKDFPTLIRAAALAAGSQPLRLIIVGKGDTASRAHLRRVADEAGLWGDLFHLAGETDNVFAWLARSAVFALPSRWEGSSMALLEALAMNVPIVATRQAGDAPHVLDNGKYGLLVDAGDAAAMAKAIVRQLSPERILPGNRASAFSAAATLDCYAAGIDRAVAKAKAPR